jgi:hypothetical protein
VGIVRQVSSFSGIDHSTHVAVSLREILWLIP